jgi:hypothetical protein
MTKYQQFTTDLMYLTNFALTNGRFIKKTVGDSTNNNRTVSVNQVVRALNGTKSRKLGNIRKNVQTVYPLVRGDIRSLRTLRGVNRTDAYDLVEFIETLGVLNGTFGRAVNHLIK